MNLLATWISALIIALSGVAKLVGNAQVVQTMTALGVGRYVRVLGVMELAFARSFVIPATFRLGFLLASCYFGGAIATELWHDALKPNPLSQLCCSGSAPSFATDRFSSEARFVQVGTDPDRCPGKGRQSGSVT